MKQLVFYGLLLVFFGANGCFSNSHFNQRFTESDGLAPPTLSTQPADPDHFSFAVVGDLHIKRANVDRLKTMLAMASAEGDSFFIFLGDIVVEGLEQDVKAFRDVLTSQGWSLKAFPVIGNHDIYNDGWTNWKKYNGPSHYSFTAGNSRFIAIDTADGSLGEAQSKWLREKVKEGSSSKNTFLVSHYLPEVPGQRTYLKLPDDVEALSLMKLASDFGVRGWLGAHYHSYLLGKIGGVEYLVAGGGGNKRLPPVREFFFVQVTVSGADISYQRHSVPK